MLRNSEVQVWGQQLLRETGGVYCNQSSSGRCYGKPHHGCHLQWFETIETGRSYCLCLCWTETSCMWSVHSTKNSWEWSLAQNRFRYFCPVSVNLWMLNYFNSYTIGFLTWQCWGRDFSFLSGKGPWRWVRWEEITLSSCFCMVVVNTLAIEQNPPWTSTGNHPGLFVWLWRTHTIQSATSKMKKSRLWHIDEEWHIDIKCKYDKISF